MNIYIFTFGFGHDLSESFQPIIAEDMEQARLQMIRVYGTRWAFGYTETEFDEAREQGVFLSLEPLKLIRTKEAV